MVRTGLDTYREAEPQSIGAQALRWLSWVAAAIFCLSLPLFEAPKNISLALAFAALLAGWLTRSVRPRWDSVALCLLAFLLAGLLSGALSPYQGEALRHSIDLACVLAAYLVFFNLIRSEREAGLVAELLLVSAGLALLSSLGGLQALKYRSVASLGYCNNVGMYYSLIGALAFSLSLYAAAAWWRSAWWGSILALAVAAMTFTFCRSALLAFGLFSCLALTGGSQRGRARWLTLLLLAVVVVTALFAAGTLPKLVAQGLGTETLRERWHIWQVAERLFIEHPLLGIGPGNFKEAAEGVLGEHARDFFYLGNAHSLYLNTVAERGILGLAIMLAFFATALRALLSARASLKTPAGSAIWWAGLGSVVIMLLIGLLDYPLHHEHGLLMAVLLALPLSVGRQASARPSLGDRSGAAGA